MYYLQYIFCLIRLMLLAVSICGYLVQMKKHIRIELAVGVLFSGISSILFAAGILHILRETAWAIWAIGIWLAVKAWKETFPTNLGKILRSDFTSPGILFGAVMALFFMVLLFQSKLIHYDNFSHWGVAAKLVCQKDMFPNAADTCLWFPSYPLGSTVFLYYITEIAGFSHEWLQMWAQAVLMVSMLISLFVFGKGPVCAATACLTAGMLLCGNISFIDLLVDTLLPVTALAAAAFCTYYKAELDKKIWYLIPYVVFLVSIKNSGALFAVLILGYAFYYIPKNRETCKAWLITAAAPAVTLFFWNRHVEQIFDDGSVSKHAMRIDNFQQVLSEKSMEDLLSIIKLYGDAIIDSGMPILYLTLLGFVLFVAAKYVLKKPCGQLLRLFLFLAASYLIYHIGTLGMYILSMPLREALILAGYDRYHQTIVIFAAGIMIIAALVEIKCAAAKAPILAVILAACTVFLSASAIGPNYSYYSRTNLEHTERAKFDRLIHDYAIQPDDRYLILVGEDHEDGGYLYHMAQYLLMPETVSIAALSDLDSIQDQAFNFVILFEDTEENIAYLQEQFGVFEEVGYIEGKPIV